jgi:ABC-type phosphate/phosphonate transport system substrate-binding protein
VPSVPVEYFEAVLHYLEVRLGCETTLRYESRWETPPADRRSPFDDIDFAWMTCSGYMKLRQQGAPIELLPVTSVHIHEKTDQRPGHWVDVIVAKNMIDTMKDFLDLRGCRWAQNTNDRLGGSLITLHNLKLLGENATFFGNVLKSKSHLETIELVLTRKAHAAAIDSNALALYLKKNPQDKDNLNVLTSWGPLPPYVMVASKTWAREIRERMVDTLLNMNYDYEGARVLKEFNVRRFASVSPNDCNIEKELVESTRAMKFDTAYY